MMNATVPKNAYESLLSELASKISNSHAEPNCNIEPISLNGELEILHMDSFDEGVSKDLYGIISNSSDKIIDIFPLESRDNNFEQGSNISLAGLLVNDEFIIVNKISQFSSSSTLNNTHIPPAPIDGNLKMVAVLINLGETLDFPVDKSVINESLVQLSEYYKLNANNRISINTDIIGPYQINQINGSSNKCPLKTETHLENHIVEILEISRNNVSYSDYNGIIVLAPYSGGECDSWNGWTNDIGIPRPRDTGEGLVNLTATYVKVTSDTNSSTLLELIGHEIGHNFGMGHANGLDCRSKVLPASSISYNNECHFIKNGDPFDIMGAKANVGHLNAPHLESLGWLSPSNIQTVTDVGEEPLAFSLKPIEIPSDELKVLKIMRNISDHLYLEFRQPIAFNETFAGGGDVYNGALLHVVMPNNTSSNPLIIDATPDNGAGGSFHSSVLHPQGFIIDPVSGIKVKVIDINGDVEGLQVELSKE